MRDAPRRHRPAGLLFVLVPVLVMNGCALPDDDLTARPVVLGDSITDSARAALAARLPDAVIDAFPGRTMATPDLSDTGLLRVSSLPAEPGRPWIVALGTNDAAYGLYPPEQLRTDLRSLLAAIPPDRCLAWILPEVTAPRPETEIENVATFGRIVVEELQAWPCSTTFAWAEVAGTPGMLDGDGVHLTPTGTEAFADLVARAAAWADEPVTAPG